MASGDLLAFFTPQDNMPPSSGFMTFDTRNGYLVLDADDASGESRSHAEAAEHPIQRSHSAHSVRILFCVPRSGFGESEGRSAAGYARGCDGQRRDRAGHRWRL